LSEFAKDYAEKFYTSLKELGLNYYYFKETETSLQV